MSDRQIGVQVEGFARTPIPARANPSPAPAMRYFVKRTILNRLIHRRIYFSVSFWKRTDQFLNSP
jgi:hypothetical protein